MDIDPNEEGTQREEQAQRPLASHSSNNRDDLGGALSPFSTYSLGTTGISGSTGIDDNASESGSSVGVQSSSSTHTGRRSLVRRAKEFDRLLQSQQHDLSQLDQPSRTDMEDDDLQSELQDLARSEVLLRKELEIFDTSFRHPGSHGGDEDLPDDTSTLPDFDDTSPVRSSSDVQSSSSSPRNRLLTPGLAPWTPPSAFHLPEDSSARVSMDSDLELPTLDELRQRRLLQSPPTTNQSPQSSPCSSSSPFQQLVGAPSDEERDRTDIGMAFPPSLLLAGSSPNFSSQNRRPMDSGALLSPARVSLDDEAPSLLSPSYLPAMASPRTTPPSSQRTGPTNLSEGLGSESSDDSVFVELARLTSTTPRVSNVKGTPGEPLYVPSPASSTQRIQRDSAPSQLPALASGDWASPRNSRAASAVPVTVPYSDIESSTTPSRQSSKQASLASSAPSVGSETLAGLDATGAFVHTRTIHGRDKRPREDHIALLDGFAGSSWKIPLDNQQPVLYPSNTAPFLSNSADDDYEVDTPAGERIMTVDRGERKGGRSAFWATVVPRRQRRPGPLLQIISSTDSGDSQPLQRRNYTALVLLVLLLLCLICVIVIPTSIVVVRKRDTSASSVRGAGVGGAGDDDQPSVSPSAPIDVSTLSPTISSVPTTSPTYSPSTKPTISAQPSASDSPSLEPTLTPRPTTARPTVLPSVSPSTAPTAYPSASPTRNPTYRPTLRPSITPTANPSAPPIRNPTDHPTLSPSASPSTSPTAVPTTFGPTLSPTNENVLTPATSGSAAPTTGLLGDLALGNLLRRVSFDGGVALDDVNSPQYAAFTWLSDDSRLDEYSAEQQIQRYAMATLYFSLGGDDWLRNDNWLSEQPECEWFSRVNRGLCGPPRRLRRLRRETTKFPRLRRLVLYYNNLQGFLPPEIGLLTDLEEIYLEGGPMKFISGSLPSEMSNLAALKEIHLANNNLWGSIPPEFRVWSDLEFLDISKNHLQGSLSDDILSGWSHLYELNLSSNLLTGRLPETWPPSLEFLNLEYNSLTGAVPPSIGILQELRSLSLDHNEFTSLPMDIISLESLENLSVAHNRLQGQILSELGFLARLRSLRLNDNSLTGTIPPEFGELARVVTILDISHNELRGPIPMELGHINDRLRNLNLSGNRLSGTIPASLTELDRLVEVRLEDNDLTGVVPDSLCKEWDRALTTVYADCAEIDCPCCNFCCTDGIGCMCRYAGDTELAWRCA